MQQANADGIRFLKEAGADEAVLYDEEFGGICKGG